MIKTLSVVEELGIRREWGSKIFKNDTPQVS